MDHVAAENPFSVEHYTFSWNDIRKHTASLINRFPEKYKLAYFNDYHEKLIILVNEDKNFFGIQDPQILIITKIDNSKKQSLVSFEMKGYHGDISSQKDYDKAVTSLQKVTHYLKLFSTVVNNN